MNHFPKPRQAPGPVRAGARVGDRGSHIDKADAMTPRAGKSVEAALSGTKVNR